MEHRLFTLQLSNGNLKLSDFLVVRDNNQVFGGKLVRDFCFYHIKQLRLLRGAVPKLFTGLVLYNIWPRWSQMPLVAGQDQEGESWWRWKEEGPEETAIDLCIFQVYTQDDTEMCFQLFSRVSGGSNIWNNITIPLELHHGSPRTFAICTRRKSGKSQSRLVELERENPSGVLTLFRP